MPKYGILLHRNTKKGRGPNFICLLRYRQTPCCQISKAHVGNDASINFTLDNLFDFGDFQ